MDIDEAIHNFDKLWNMRPWPLILFVVGLALFIGLVVDVWVIKQRWRRRRRAARALPQPGPPQQRRNRE